MDDWASIPGRSLCYHIHTASGAHLASIQWVLGALSPRVKPVGHAAAHSPPSSSKVKSVWIYTSIPPCIFMALCLVK